MAKSRLTLLKEISDLKKQVEDQKVVLGILMATNLLSIYFIVKAYL